MSKIEISVAVDATKPEELKALSNYLLALANLSGVKTPETNTTIAAEVKETDATPAASKKRQTSKAKAEAPKEEQETPAAEAPKEEQETPAAEAAKEEAPEEVKEAAPAKEESEIKLDTLRTLLSKKVDANRDAIKDKLTELGTKNLTTLDPKDYQTMYDFFMGLKDSE